MCAYVCVCVYITSLVVTVCVYAFCYIFIVWWFDYSHVKVTARAAFPECIVSLN